MSDFSEAVRLICKHEGFNEKAYADPVTEADPYTIGFGTQFYPDGEPVKRGQCCTKHKAMEYLYHELAVIDQNLEKLNLGLDTYMRQALQSFIHSVGWESFLYSAIPDLVELEDWPGTVKTMNQWIYDYYHNVVGGMVERRREEAELFLKEIKVVPHEATDLLLAAFRSYTAAPHEVKAIRNLEKSLSPYELAQFANNFKLCQNPWSDVAHEEMDAIFNV
jgi:lysozyme